MIGDSELKYEDKSVRAVRGLEARTIAKVESDGWELVGQTPGRLTTELKFRRVKPKPRYWVAAVAGGVVVVAIGTLILVGALSGSFDRPKDTSAEGTTPSASATSQPTETAPPPAPVPSVTPAAPAPVALDETNAAQYLAMQWEATFTYGGEGHWIVDRITTKNPDGPFTFKIGATVKNAYGTEMQGTVEGDVTGTNDDMTITDSILYTDHGSVVNYNG